MTADVTSASGAGSPKRRRFVAAADRPAPDLVARQMEATTLAFRILGSVEAARGFLNDVDEALGGRPLDIAGASVDGLRRVSERLATRAAAAPSDD